jgi:hypothetical protein
MDIFRGLKFSPNAEIGENSHSRMDTSWRLAEELMAEAMATADPWPPFRYK